VVRIGVIGLGKMGLSHLAIANAHASAQVVAVCDSVGYLLGVLSKYTGVQTYSDARKMFERAGLDAVIIATPSASHYELAAAAIDHGLHVFCEKPLTLSQTQSAELEQRAADAGVIAQVGYHNRFIGTFREVKRLLDLNAIGTVSHVLAEAYGPVVLRGRGSTWRSRRSSGGGCLYDYAAHPLDLVQWYFGEPLSVSGSVLGQVFSADTDDEVYSTLSYRSGLTAQISVNWSDESERKMTTSVTIRGEGGKISADRNELRVYLRDTVTPPPGYASGWNVRNTTQLTDPVDFYLRGEEYSAQIDHFIAGILDPTAAMTNRFTSGAATDRMIAAIIADAEAGAVHTRQGTR
jgi:scyllo-inositol 2-dehydrogenase (NADP+)